MKKKFVGFRKSVDIPIGITDDYYMEIYSDREIVLTGFGEIETLEDSVLKIKFGAQKIVFSGSKINISNYTSDGIKISGYINKIEFLKRNDLL